MYIYLTNKTEANHNNNKSLSHNFINLTGQRQIALAVVETIIRTKQQQPDRREMYVCRCVSKRPYGVCLWKTRFQLASNER